MQIIYGINDKEGVLGYKFMSSFIYALGNRVFAFSFGLIMLFASQQITNNYKKPFKYISYIILYIASFFMIQLFIPRGQLLNAFGIRDFPQIFYFASMILLAISSVFVLTLFQKAFIYSEEKIKTLVNLLFKFRNDHYEKMAVKALYAEKENPPIDGVNAIDQVKEFEDEFYDTIVEVTKITKGGKSNKKST